MNKQQSQAIASVICRAVDYWHARATAEQDAMKYFPETADAKKIISNLKESESRIAQALECVDEPEDDETAHKVG